MFHAAAKPKFASDSGSVPGRTQSRVLLILFLFPRSLSHDFDYSPHSRASGKVPPAEERLMKAAGSSLVLVCEGRVDILLGSAAALHFPGLVTLTFTFTLIYFKQAKPT